MTPAQALLQYQHRARTVVWSSNSPLAGATIWGTNGVRISTGFRRDILAKLPVPCVILSPGKFRGSEQNPRFGDFTIVATFFAAEMQDPFGSDAALALLNAVWAWMEAMDRMGGDTGLLVQGITIEQPQAIEIEGCRPMVTAQVQIAVRCGSYAAADYTPPVTGFGATGGAGTCALAWTRPVGYGSRYDWLGTTIRRKAGSSPTGPTDGTAVATAEAGATFNETSVPAGTWYYAAFGAYDLNADGTADTWSPAATATATVT